MYRVSISLLLFELQFLIARSTQIQKLNIHSDCKRELKNFPCNMKLSTLLWICTEEVLGSSRNKVSQGCCQEQPDSCSKAPQLGAGQSHFFSLSICFLFFLWDFSLSNMPRNFLINYIYFYYQTFSAELEDPQRQRYEVGVSFRHPEQVQQTLFLEFPVYVQWALMN